MAVHFQPPGYHKVTPYLVVRDPAPLIEFMKTAFGAVERHRTDGPNGKIMHAEVTIGDSIVMLGQAPPNFDPTVGGLYVYVEDVDSSYARALAAGAASTMPPADMFYGDRMGGVKDPAGNYWWLATRKEEVSEAELKRRVANGFKK